MTGHVKDYERRMSTFAESVDENVKANKKARILSPPPKSKAPAVVVSAPVVEPIMVGGGGGEGGDLSSLLQSMEIHINSAHDRQLRTGSIHGADASDGSEFVLKGPEEYGFSPGSTVQSGFRGGGRGGEEKASEPYPWEERMDEASGHNYYYNYVNNESQWDKPSDFDLKVPPGVVVGRSGGGGTPLKPATPEAVAQYKSALTSALTTISTRFSSLESQMFELTENIAEKSEKDRRMVLAEQEAEIERKRKEIEEREKRLEELERVAMEQSLKPPPSIKSPKKAHFAPPSAPPPEAPVGLAAPGSPPHSNLTSLMKSHSPPISSSTAVTGLGAGTGADVIYGLRGGVSTPHSLAYHTPGQIPNSTRSLRTQSSMSSIGNISGVSAISSSPSMYGSRHRSTTSSSLKKATRETTYKSPMRSPFRTRDRSDEYFRSLGLENSRKISFDQELLKVRRSASGVRGVKGVGETREVRRMSQVSEGYVSGGSVGGQSLGGFGSEGEEGGKRAMYEISEEAKALIELRSPEKTYKGLHGRRGGDGLKVKVDKDTV